VSGVFRLAARAPAFRSHMGTVTSPVRVPHVRVYQRGHIIIKHMAAYCLRNSFREKGRKEIHIYGGSFIRNCV